MSDIQKLLDILDKYNKICPEGYKLSYVYKDLGTSYLKCQYERVIYSISPTSDGVNNCVIYLEEKIKEIEKKRSLETFKPAIRELYKLCDVNRDGFLELVKSAITEQGA